MKTFLSCLAVFCLGMLSAGEKIYLNPSAPVGIFRRNNGKWHSAASRLRLSYSASRLTLEAVLTVPPGRTFKAAGKPGDETAVFGGEVFEFQVAPAGQSGIYYHFGISPSGLMYTARCRDTRWKPSRDVLESRVDGNQWHLLLSVPFSDLHASTPKPGEVWRINLARTDVSSGQGRIAASHSGAADYHQPAQYSEVVFGEEAPPGASIQLQDIRLKPDLLQIQFIAVHRKPLELRLELYADEKLCCSRNAVMRDGSLSVQIPFPFRKMPLKGGIPARIVLKNAGNGEILCSTSGILAMPSDPLWLNRFYYTPSDSMIRFRHNLSGTTAVRLYDNHGKPVVAAASGNSIPLSGLQPGRYVLEVSNGRTSVSRILFLLERPWSPGPLPAGQSLSVSKGQLRFGGKPVFLLGLSPTAKSYLQFSDAFNLSFNRAGVRGNSAILGGLPDGKLIRNPFLGRIFPPDREYLGSLSDRVRKTSPESARTLWRISYEAQIPKAVRTSDGSLVPADTGDFMYKIYQTVKKANPSLIYSIQTDSPARIKDLSRACDVLEVAFGSSSYADDMIPNLQKDLLRTKREAASGKPVVFWLGGTIPNRHCRLAEEIRAAVYLSVLHGFSGNIIHMGHGFLPAERSRLWSLLSGIHAEIESFYDSWAAGEEFPVTIPKPFAGKAVRTASGEILLLVINPTPYDVCFSCRMPGIPQNGLFTAYEPKLYRLPRPQSSPSE